MKKFLIAFALLLLFAVWYMNGTTTSNPASGPITVLPQPLAVDALQPAQPQPAAAIAQVEAARSQVTLTADAQALLAAQQQAQATATVQAQFVQQAVQANEAQATIEARAMLAAQQDAQATATNQAMFAQQAAQANEAKATVDTRAVLLVQQQAQATATAQAMQRESVTAVQAASASRQQSETLAWLIPIGAVIVFGVAVLLGTKHISGLIDRANERRSLKNRKLDLITTLLETHNETLALADDPAALPLLNLLTDGEGDNPGESFANLSLPIDTEILPAAVIPPNDDSLLPDQEEAREAAARHKLVMKLLRDAIGHTQVHSNHIPSALQLGWAANAWAIAVAILRPYGVETLPGDEGGTYLVGEYPTLQALYIAMGENT
jgi:hypothetical protein